MKKFGVRPETDPTPYGNGFLQRNLLFEGLYASFISMMIPPETVVSARMYLSVATCRSLILLRASAILVPSVEPACLMASATARVPS